MSKVGGWEPSGFGARLRAVRDTKGLSQAALGDAAGVHPNTIAKLERGEHEPAWPLVLALAKALGVDCTAFSSGGSGEDASSPEAEEAAEKPAPKKPKGGKK